MNASPSLTEAAWQAQVLALAKLCGWRVAHFRPAMTQSGRWVTPVQADGKGFPDLVLVRGGVLLVVELKAERGRLSDEQAAWLTAFRGVPGVRVEVWRPADWDAVVAALGGGRVQVNGG